jgi:oligopeptidase B
VTVSFPRSVVRLVLVLPSVVLFLASPAHAQGTADSAVYPPTAKMIPKVDSTAGDIRVDNYFWLRDDERKNPDVLAYLDAENRYTAATLKHTEPLEQQLFAEMKGRIKETDLSVPQRIGHYFYYSRTEAGHQYAIFCRTKGSLAAPEEIILDENPLGAGHAYFHVGVARISPNEQLLAFTVDTSGAERYSLVVKDLSTGAMRPDSIRHVNYSLQWAADNRTLFYGNSDSANRAFAIVRHTLGAAQSADSVVFREPDVLYEAELGKTADHKYILINDFSYNQSSVLYLPADKPLAPFRTLVPRTDGVLVASVRHRKNSFLVLTNDHALNFKIVALNDAAPASAAPTTVIDAQDSVLIEGFDVLRDYIVLYERGHAQRTIRVLAPERHVDYVIPFPDSISTFYEGSNNEEFDTDLLRYTYTSFVTPPTVYDFDLSTRVATVKKRTEVLGGYDPTRYATERIWATAADGARVPISIVYRTPLVRDGTRPLLLYGYGSYGYSTDPEFDSPVVSLLDRGVIYAVAHIRGGQEMGRQWYEDGRLLHKKNTFTDFVAAAEYLVARKYTSTDRLAMHGASAGGLLMGAVVNLRPDLFKAVVADVPFVDVITTMSDSTIPLTAGEWLQWGDPRAEPYYSYMKSYSPYDNVARKAYPAMLVTAGLNDPRVGYWEPAKWVARLRASKTDDHILLLRTNMGAGHGGASGRYDALHEESIRYAFILDQLGLGGVAVP